MPILVKAEGREFTFPDNTPDEDIAFAVDEFFASQQDLVAEVPPAQPVAQQPTEKPPLTQRILDPFTGALRQTPETQTLPELGRVLSRAQESQTLRAREAFAPQEIEAFQKSVEEQGLAPAIESLQQSASPEGIARVSAGILSSFSPQEQINIIQENIPGATTRTDEKGNTIIKIGETETVLNKPGFTQQDFSQALSTALLFAPAAGLASLPSRLISRLAIGGLGAGATQAAIEAQQERIGGKFDVGDVALSLGLGAGAEVLNSIVGAAFRSITGKKPPTNLFDEAGEITPQGQQVLKEANVTEEQLRNSLQNLRQDLNVPEQLRLQRAQRFGIDLRQSKLGRDFETQQKENILLSSGGSSAAEAKIIEKESFEQIKNAQDAFLDTLGGTQNLSRAEKGKALKDSLKTLKNEERAAVSALYKTAEDLAGGEVPLDNQKILNLFEEKILERPVKNRVIESAERVLAKFGIIGKEPQKKGAFTTVVNEEGKTIKFKGDVEPLTIGSSEEFRKALNEIVGTDDTGAILNIVRGLDNQIEETLSQFADEAGSLAKAQAFKEARQAFREFKGKFSASDVIDDLTAFKRGSIDTPKIQPSEALDTLLRGEKKLENIEKLKRILTGPTSTQESRVVFNNIKTEAIGDIFKKSANLNEAGDINSISGKKLNAALAKFGDDALKALLNAKSFKELKELQKTIGDATFQVPRAENTSRTAAEFFARLGNIFGAIDAIPGGQILTKGSAVLVEPIKMGAISRNLKLLKSAKPSKAPVDIQERNKIVIRILSQLAGKEDVRE